MSTPSSRAKARTAGLAYGASPGITMLAPIGGRACGDTSPSGALCTPWTAAGADFGAAGAGAGAGAGGFAASGALLPPPSPAAGEGDAATAAPSASMMAITAPSETSSPTLSFISLMVPANGAGTSIVALSDSSVTRLWSFSTLSPALTSTSMTGTPS